MGLIIIGTDWDSPPIPHLCDPVISTRPRRPRGDGHVVTWLTEALTWEKALSKSWISIGRICRESMHRHRSHIRALGSAWSRGRCLLIMTPAEDHGRTASLSMVLICSKL
jgi:hypothetical protein